MDDKVTVTADDDESAFTDRDPDGVHETLVADNARLRDELATAVTRIANLEAALDTSRAIGAAVGILMTQRGLTDEQAFELLQSASQRKHRKLRDIAERVKYTGALDD